MSRTSSSPASSSSSPALITSVEERKSTIIKGRKTCASPMLHDALNCICKASYLRGMGLLILLSLLLAGCGSSTANAPTRGNGSVRPTHSFAGLVDIRSGRKMYLECRGSGSPTVVLVSGLDSAADVWIGYQAHPSLAVFAQVAGFTRVCAYDRPGTPVGDDLMPSRSTPVPQPTTAHDAVRDLHALPKAAGEPGPYLLVGHSYGGLITMLYAGEYASSVAGIVFVDAFAPEWETALTPEQWHIVKAITGPSKDQLTKYPAMERIDFDASVAQARSATLRRSLPSCRRTSDTSTTARETRRRTRSRGLCRTPSTSSSRASTTTYRSTIHRL